MHTLHNRHIARQLGFSLVELMVAMALSLLLLAGALSVLYTSRLSYAENDKLARVQETGRTVMELLLRDVRASGFNGCARPIQTGDFANDIAGGAASPLRNFAEPLGGYEVGGSAPSLHADLSGLSPTLNSDILVIRAAREGQPSFRTVAELLGASTAAIKVAFSSGTTVAAATPMVIADCRGATAFLAATFTSNGDGTADITYAGAGAGGSLTRGFDAGASVTPVESIVYFVAPASSGTGTSLWQKVGTAARQELVEGVENLQFLYGRDTNGDRVPDSYVTANNVTNWNNIVSLQIGVLVRSEQEYGNSVDSRTFTVLGTNVGSFSDHRLRSVFTTTVSVRNRAN